MNQAGETMSGGQRLQKTLTAQKQTRQSEGLYGKKDLKKKEKNWLGSGDRNRSAQGKGKATKTI